MARTMHPACEPVLRGIVVCEIASQAYVLTYRVVVTRIVTIVALTPQLIYNRHATRGVV